jgi:thymidylate synthase (FAD)
MEAIKPTYEIVNEPNWDDVIIGLEKAIRTCYKSEKAINAGTADKLIRNIIKRGHESTLEHHSMTVRFVCDRGVSHELVRHRHCSFSQESTRYVNYAPNQVNNQGDMKFILPCWVDDDMLGSWDTDKLFHDTTSYYECDMEYPPEFEWVKGCIDSQQQYRNLIDKGWNPEHARTVLPNSLKTEIVVTSNMRDWRHIFSLRCDKTAHPQMRELMVPLWEELSVKCPTLFDSIEFENEDWTTIKKRITKAG